MAQLNYLNFDLLISHLKNEYIARVISPVGESMSYFALPFSEVEIENVLLRISRARRGRQPGSSDYQAIKEFGKLLYTTIFTGLVLENWRRSLDHAVALGSGLRIRLRLLDAPKLAGLPWEYLYDNRRHQFLALSSNTPLTRYLELPTSISPLIISPPLRLLTIITNPVDAPQLNANQEWIKIQTSLEEYQKRGLLSCERLAHASLSGLQQALRRNTYHIIHFVGHAGFDDTTKSGFLLFEDERGQSRRVDAYQLGTLLHGASSLRLIVLSACEGARSSIVDPFAGIAQSLSDHGVPAVIASQFEMTDAATIIINRELYGAIIEGQPIDVAVTEARKALHLQSNDVEWGAPVLYLHSPNGHIFDIIEVTATEAARISEERRLATSESLLREAARIKQIEKSANLLRSCETLETIAKVHRELSVGDLSDSDPIGSVLRSFSRASKDVDAAIGQTSNYNQRLALSAVEERLDGLLRELARSNLENASLFRPIVTTWRQIVAISVQKLVKSVEQQQEIDNPYVIGLPLSEQQEIFVGRVDIGSRIEQLLLDRRRPPLMLYGQRRMGKTSLLNNLGSILPSTIIPLFVNLQGPPTQASDHAGLLYNIARAMISSARRYRNLNLFRLTRESLTADPFTRFDEWLDEVEQSLGQNVALLIFDEFEALDRALSNQKFSESEVLGMLRHVIQHRPRFKVLLAGSHTLDELQRWSSYLINVQVVHISYLKEEEARQLIEQPTKNFTLHYDSDASQRILLLTHSHPFLVQLLCSEIVALKNGQRITNRRLATLADVEAAVPEALEHGSLFFADIERNQIDAEAVSVLKFIASKGEQAVVSKAALIAQFSEENIIDRSLVQLMRRELIQSIDNSYRFQVELIRRWFVQNK